MRFLPISVGLCLLVATQAGAQQHAPNASLEPGDLAEFAAQPARVQELITAGLALTKRNLDYTFGSDDPANGGMDCSGTMYHLLREHGWKDVPRDSPGQYEWVRAAGGFHDVTGIDTAAAEFAAMQPGDLMFWSGTYETHREGVAVSHVMLYLGTEAKTHQRVMFGASDGRTYRGVQRYGVSVFDFKMPRAEQKARFLGYGRIPGLPRGTLAVIAAVPPPAVVEEEEAPSSGAKKKSATGKAKTTTVASEDVAAKARSKTAQTKADTDDDAADAPKAKTPARKSNPGQKSKTTAQAKTDSPEPTPDEPAPKSKTAKTGTSKSKTGTGKSKASTQEPAADVAQTDSEDSDAPKSKTKSTKSKGTAAASSGEADAAAKKPTAGKSGTPSSKASAAKSKAPALEAKPVEQTTKAGFQKPKTDPSEPSSDEPKTKPVGGFLKSGTQSADTETTSHKKTPSQKHKPGAKPKTPEAKGAE